MDRNKKFTNAKHKVETWERRTKEEKKSKDTRGRDKNQIWEDEKTFSGKRTGNKDSIR